MGPVTELSYRVYNLNSKGGGERTNGGEVGWPGFSWNKLHFCPSNWYGIVVWIWCENDIDNTLMFLLLLSIMYPKSRIFQLLLLNPNHNTLGKS